MGSTDRPLTLGSTLPLRIELSPVSMMRWQLFTTMADAFEKSAAQNGGGGELDELKRALIETSPWLLITTAVVTVSQNQSNARSDRDRFCICSSRW